MTVRQTVSRSVRQIPSSSPALCVIAWTVTVGSCSNCSINCTNDPSKQSVQSVRLTDRVHWPCFIRDGVDCHWRKLQQLRVRPSVSQSVRQSLSIGFASCVMVCTITSGSCSSCSVSHTTDPVSQTVICGSRPASCVMACTVTDRSYSSQSNR